MPSSDRSGEEDEEPAYDELLHVLDTVDTVEDAGPRPELDGPVSREVAAVEAKARGTAALQTGDFDGAVKQLKEARSLEPSDAVIRLLLEVSSLCQWEKRDIPVLSLANYDSATWLVDEITQAASEAKAKGNAAFRNGRFAAATMLFAEVLRFNPRDTITSKLFELSQMRVWENSGIPAFRCRNFNVAKQLVEKCRKIEGMEVEALKTWYASVGFPEEAGLGKDELSKLYKQFIIWQCMPLAELQKESLSKQITVSRAFVGDEHRQLQQLAKSLLLEERMDAWEARGLQAKRFGDVYTVCQLVQEYEHVDRMTMDELKKVYHDDLKFPEESSITKDELVQLMRKFHFWSKLPPAEILKECKHWKVPGIPTHQDPSEEELSELPWKLVLQERMNTWESRGFPVKRLAHIDNVVKMIVESNHAENLSVEELKEWYKGLGFPLESRLEKDEFVQLYKKLALWRNLPLAELRKECTSILATLDATCGMGDEKEQREKYMVKLLCQDRMESWEAKGLQVKRFKDVNIALHLVQAYEDIEQDSLENLQVWYKEFNFPDQDDMRECELRKFKKTVEFWRYLPTAELRVECAKFRLAFMAMKKSDTDEQQRNHFIEHLLMQNRMQAWEAAGFPAKKLNDFNTASRVMTVCKGFQTMSDDELKKLCSDWDLAPPSEVFDRVRILETLQSVVIWESLTARQLEKECLERGLPISGGGVRNLVGKLVESKQAEEERRHILIKRLKMDMRMNLAFANDSKIIPHEEASPGFRDVADSTGSVEACDRTELVTKARSPSNDCVRVHSTTTKEPDEEPVEDHKSISDWYDQPDLTEDQENSDSAASIPDLLDVNEQLCEEQPVDWYNSGQMPKD